ncbi:shufflon system plasmid conjugative transfer pilus tip adhesin PilV [Ralstonia pseudosolanacearum]|uniref:shufflon system plasmid conjugative transfer pilus tip adhesin PilV n=1 Tax=Ralstonia pseudosolanacearum TaxID=1310165 RepID=UPI001FF71B95|nr:shufflon system plasmid conjugative transfer pilus tip adhesin PilV [Ralstonia pseudosolanacearum]
MSEVLGVLFAIIVGLTFIPKLSTISQTASDNTRAASTAQQQLKLIDVGSDYIKKYSTNLQSVTTSTSPAIITVPMLQAVNLLDGSFNATNPYGQTWQIAVLQPSPGNLQALVMSYGGTAMNDMTASKIAGLVGQPGGIIPKNDSGIYPGGAATAYGSWGGWTQSTANYPSVSGGHVAALLNFNNGQLSSNYLYRNAVPGQQQLNTMNTPVIYGPGAIGTLNQPCSPVGAFGRDSMGASLSCQGIDPNGKWQKASTSPNMYRYVFTSSTSWTVPSGVKSALVTMAGGGASGLGWRFASQYITGSSGGFVFSAPVNLTAGETLSVVVGKGAPGYGPLDSGRLAPPEYVYHIMVPPSNDDGLGGYPGERSQLVSPSQGVLLECDGGSGATTVTADTINGGVLIPGPNNGAWAYSGLGTIPVPNRVAAGPYANGGGGPGACGYSAYGIGNPGQNAYTPDPAHNALSSGTYPGGLSPFGYGSGGSVSISGCRVDGPPNQANQGTCVWNNAGRDGVVIIDVLY